MCASEATSWRYKLQRQVYSPMAREYLPHGQPIFCQTLADALREQRKWARVDGAQGDVYNRNGECIA